MKRAVLWLFVLGLVGGLGYGAWRYAGERRFAATRFGEGSRTVNIPAGTGLRALSRLLAEAHVVSDANRFYFRYLFNRDPPFLDNALAGLGYDQENADPYGRILSLWIRMSW